MSKPICKLVGTDGNVFAIIGNVSKCLKEADLIEQAKEFQERAFASKSYGDVISLCQEYVNIE
jgi:hypothetical protein